LTGNAADDETVTDFPMMLEIPGVITSKVQDIETVAVSPTFVPLNVGAGAVRTPPMRGSWQFVAVASFLIWAWYLALTAGFPAPDQAVGLFAARLAAMRVMLWRLTQPR
jgi:hypothetical protein